MVWGRHFSRSGSKVFKVKSVLGGRANAMFQRSRQTGERTQIRDPKEVNFPFLNAPYQLFVRW
jgi:hypothetical protein